MPGLPEPGGASLTDDRSWHSSISDPGDLKALTHLEKYGSLSEEQIIQMLNGVRGSRRFGMRLEGYRQFLPFAVFIETTATGKRYLKG